MGAQMQTTILAVAAALVHATAGTTMTHVLGLTLLATTALSTQREVASPGFQPNLGQWPAPVLFHSRFGALHGWLENDGWTLALFDEPAVERAPHAWAVRLNWPAPRARVAPRRPLDSTFSCFRGADPQRWRGAALLHEQVVFEELAPGIALVARCSAKGPEFDLEVAPGVDPSSLLLTWTGHCGLELDATGALAVHTPLGALRLPQPMALMSTALGVEWTECRYRLVGEDAFVLETPERPLDAALWIDPALHWGTYLGGQSQQWIEALELLPSGDVVVAGTTDSIDYPTTAGSFQPFSNGGTEAFVSVLAADGRSLLHSTLIGGLGDERVVGVGVAPGGAIVVAGDTNSADFPTTQGAFDTTLGGSADVFVARLSPDLGALEWSTLIGGASVERAGGMALRSSGATVLAGATRGAAFPTTPGAYDTTYNGGSFAGDVFVLELAPDGSSLHWSTFLGGPSEELAERVALGPGGEVTVSGMAYGPGFPTTLGAFDRSFDGFEEPFVARLNAQGSTLVFSTFLGGEGEDSLLALLVRSDGATWIGGRTDDPLWPTSVDAMDRSYKGPSEGFVVLLASSGDSLLHSTFFGGVDEDAVRALAVTADGKLIVGLETSSPDLPTTPGAFDRHFASSIGGNKSDVYLARCKADLSGSDYLTYFGGRNPERLSGIAVDAQGALILAGVTNGADLPTTIGALQPAWNVTALAEGFVARLELLRHPIEFGAGKLNSGGSVPTIHWWGFPSVADQNFSVGIDSAMPNAWCTVFSSLTATDQPFCGGRLFLRPPFTRYLRFKSDFFGWGTRSISLAPWLAGQTMYFQVWYVDDDDNLGCGLTDALAVFVYP